MTSYPDLAEHKDLLYELRDAAMSRKMQFASEQEAFNFIAQNARNILAKVRGNNGGQVPQSTPGQPQYAMPSTSMGGATGSGNRSQGQQASPVKQLFN